MQLKIINRSADPGLIIPAGISRNLVRGFAASYLRSIYQIKAIAALRANTIQSITSVKSFQLIVELLSCTPRKKPTKAKGIAKMVWLNFIKERYFVISQDNEAPGFQHFSVNYEIVNIGACFQ